MLSYGLGTVNDFQLVHLLPLPTLRRAWSEATSHGRITHVTQKQTFDRGDLPLPLCVIPDMTHQPALTTKYMMF